jgi:hypothetical protein
LGSLATAAAVLGIGAVLVARDTHRPDALHTVDHRELDNAPYSALNTWGFGGTTARGAHDDVEQQVVACMSERGWHYDPVPMSDPHEPVTIGALRAYRAEHGYGLADATSLPPGPSKEELDQQQNGAGYARDLGQPSGRSPNDGSCYSQVMANMAKTTPFYAIPLAIGEEETKVTSDPRFVRAISEWSTCLARATGITGLTVLEQARQHVAAGQLTGDALRAEEHRVAVADFRCQEATVIPARVRLETAAVERLRATYPQFG